MSRYAPRIIVIDGRETTIRAFAENAGLSYEAVRQRLKLRTPVYRADGMPTWTSAAVLTDARDAAAKAAGANKRDHVKRARIAELLASVKPNGKRYTKEEIAADVGISRARLYQILAKL